MEKTCRRFRSEKAGLGGVAAQGQGGDEAFSSPGEWNSSIDPSGPDAAPFPENVARLMQ